MHQKSGQIGLLQNVIDLVKDLAFKILQYYCWGEKTQELIS